MFNNQFIIANFDQRIYSIAKLTKELRADSFQRDTEIFKLMCIRHPIDTIMQGNKFVFRLHFLSHHALRWLEVIFDEFEH